MDIERLKALRLERKLKQNQVAKALEISPQRYSYYETGDRQPDNEMLIKLAQYFEVSVDYLLGNSEIQEIINKSRKNSKVSENMKLLQDYEKLPQSEKDIIKYIITRNKKQ